MANFDLKPLTQDIIQKLGLEGHALWKVKCGDETYGPFDTPSLTHYAIANTEIMESAEACHWDADDFKAFFSYPEFKKVEVTHQQEVEEKVQYWLMENGLKSQPYQKEFILKKLKAGSLSRYCEISTDDGHSWKKVPSIPEFASYFVASTELPRTPHDSSFNRAKTQVLNELDHKEESGIQSALPSFAYIAQNQTKAVVLKVDELTLQDEDAPVQVAKALKWAIPGAAVFIAVAVFIGLQISKQKEADPLTVEADPIASPKFKARAAHSQRGSHSARYDQRQPAAYGPRSSLTQQPVFRDDIPTHIETHSDEYGPDLSARESAESPSEPEPMNQEASLVDNGAPSEEQSLDAAMNVSQAPPPNDPVVLEQPDSIEAPAPDQPSDI